MIDMPFLTDLYEKDFDTAKGKGWTIDTMDLYKSGPVMVRDSKFIWRVVPGKWVCADYTMTNGEVTYENSRYYESLHDALEVE
jgi:hypothetical protein